MTAERYTGPQTDFAKETHSRKYRGKGESFSEYATRVADTLADDDEHFAAFRDILGVQRFLPAGRIQSAVGSPRSVTAFNCFVSPSIPDSMEGIMDVAKYAALTMRLGGGIGYDFSTIRPNGSNIVSLDSPASGPLSFMEIFNATCNTVSSAGNRRGAQMAVLRVDHPDIEEFIEAKTKNEDSLKAFNISVGVTDHFMEAIRDDKDFDLKFGTVVYSRVKARKLWNKLMRATWDWAEPGVLFLDRINNDNNLWYCEKIHATNPCGEQPLPPNGACLLGSFNLVKYVASYTKEVNSVSENVLTFNWELFGKDIHHVVRAMDNVIDNTTYPLPDQHMEAVQKRRMGIGVTALANALEYMGMPYASTEFLKMEEDLLKFLANEAYMASSQLAIEKGTFPLYNESTYPQSKFVQRLDRDVQEHIQEFGVRNSHLLSIAPTGTISICADNVSGGIEPVFAHHYNRTVVKNDGPVIERVEDYGVKFLGVNGKTAGECSTDEHLAVLLTAQKWIDSSCSKTINVGNHVSWDEFKDIYYKAWEGGAKGVTTFRAAGKRYGILNAIDKEEEPTYDAEACYIDPITGNKSCS